jgi:hypothetical protein
MTDTTTTEVNTKRLADIEAAQERLRDQIKTSNEQARGYVDTEIGRIMGRVESTSNSHHHVLENMAERIEAIEILPVKPDLSEIYAALAAAQLEIQNADANIENEFLNKRYADLASTLNAVREPLAKNGIALFQQTADPGQGVLGIKTTLAHSSGQTLEDLITMAPPKNDPQGIGSCRTYMRRYAVLAMCGIAGALDDDAESTKTDPNDYPRISESEVEKIIYEADQLFGDRADAAVKKMLARVFGGLTVVGDIREGEAKTALTALANSKKLMVKNEKAAAKREEAAAKKAAEEK